MEAERVGRRVGGDRSEFGKESRLETVERCFWEYVESQMLETSETP
jgi:hypothetical protein